MNKYIRTSCGCCLLAKQAQVSWLTDGLFRSIADLGMRPLAAEVIFLLTEIDLLGGGWFPPMPQRLEAENNYLFCK